MVSGGSRFNFKTGDWVLIWNGKEIYIAEVLDTSKSFIVKPPKGKQRKEKPDRAILRLSSSSDVNALYDKLTSITQDHLVEDDQLQELWEVLSLEPRGYTLDEIFHLVSVDIGSSESVLLAAKLIMDSFRFKVIARAPLTLEPLTESEVYNRLRAHLSRRERDRRVNSLTLKLIELSEGRSVEGDELIEKILDELEEALKANSALKPIRLSSELEEAFKRADLPIKRSLLLKLLHLYRYENYSELLLRIYGLETDFPDKVKRLVNRISGEFEERIREERWWRESWEDLFTFTVDDESTEDYDDAIVIPPNFNGPPWEIWIAIADPSELFFKDDVIYQEAVSRYSTIYLPDMKVNMLPPELSADKASLVAGDSRLAIGVRLVITSNGSVELIDVQPVVIRVDLNMTYEELDEMIARNMNPFKRVYELALRIRDWRLSSGAVIISLPQVKVKLENGVPKLKLYPGDTPATLTVSELMIALNYAVSTLYKEYGLPAIYRVQDKPNEKLEEVLQHTGRYLRDVINLRRVLKYLPRSYFSTNPGRHYLLGVDSYMQFSSPLRRAFDLINHFQLKSFMRKCEPIYTEEELRDIINYSIATMKVVDAVSSSSNTFWLYKYISQLLPLTTRGLILDIGDTLHVYLNDYGLEVHTHNPGLRDVKVGDEVMLRVEEVDPYTPSLRVRVLKEPEEMVADET